MRSNQHWFPENQSYSLSGTVGSKITWTLHKELMEEEE